MRIIRFEIVPGRAFNVTLPEGAELHHIGTETDTGGTKCYAWALADLDAPPVARFFGFIRGMEAGDLPHGTRLIDNIEIQIPPPANLHLPQNGTAPQIHSTRVFLVEFPADSEPARELLARAEETTTEEVDTPDAQGGEEVGLRVVKPDDLEDTPNTAEDSDSEQEEGEGGEEE